MTEKRLCFSNPRSGQAVGRGGSCFTGNSTSSIANGLEHTRCSKHTILLIPGSPKENTVLVCAQNGETEALKRGSVASSGCGEGRLQTQAE
jgi:hypothetical protein